MSGALPDDARLAETAGSIAGEIRSMLLQVSDPVRGGESLSDPDDLKSAHGIDDRAAIIARRMLADFHCNVVIEGGTADIEEDAAFSVYIDPVDGSLNWDRGVGDPGFVLAAAPGPRADRLDDLHFAYVEGLRSGDRYRTAEGTAFHHCRLTGRERRLRTAAPERLAEATGYLRPGYGGARRQLVATLPLYLGARDLRAIDNAAIEFAEIARNAAHFLVEARGISDGFNVLAWPLVRAAGGVLYGLDGSDLPTRAFEPSAPLDYLLAGNNRLADELLECMQGFAVSERADLESLLGRLG